MTPEARAEERRSAHRRYDHAHFGREREGELQVDDGPHRRRYGQAENILRTGLHVLRGLGDVYKRQASPLSASSLMAI